MFRASKTCLISGTLSMISSGVASRFALYSGKISDLNEPPGGSNTTAKCVGFSTLITSKIAFVNPNTAEVFTPFELILGFLINA